MASFWDLLPASWLQQATDKMLTDAANYQQGGVPALMANTQPTQDLAGGFLGTTLGKMPNNAMLLRQAVAESEQPLAQAYYQGLDAFKSGMGLQDNPHAIAEHAAQWERAFKAEQKQARFQATIAARRASKTE